MVCNDFSPLKISRLYYYPMSVPDDSRQAFQESSTQEASKAFNDSKIAWRDVHVLPFHSEIVISRSLGRVGEDSELKLNFVDQHIVLTTFCDDLGIDLADPSETPETFARTRQPSFG
jgi:hypothetical protein